VSGPELLRRFASPKLLAESQLAESRHRPSTALFQGSHS
jgi:hypothetical protein